MEYDTTPDDIWHIDTCQGSTPNYQQRYPYYEGGNVWEYAISIGPFSPHNLVDCMYTGTSKVAGNLVCSGGVTIKCTIPWSTETRSCGGVGFDTPLVFAEW